MAPLLSWLLFISLACGTLLVSGSTVSEGDREVYIVYMGDLPKAGAISISSLHTNMLQEVLGSSDASKYLVRSYKRSFNGFVAELSMEEMKRLSGMKGVVSVFPNEKMQLHTTRSWDFLGLPLKAKRNTTTESDIIIGMLDGGIWPESESFSDKGFGPPPSKWKGNCQTSSNVTCNNKIVGARYYRSDGSVPEGDFDSARDAQGHGTHTASTAAGSIVPEASLFGIASGTARGGVPSARIAVYKVCWSDGCNGADILAAFDDAIADGVDVISVSLGGATPRNYFDDPISIGAFHSMKNGILTANSAGNSGPDLATITNFSPWSLSVAASTIDRKLLTKLVLGNNDTYEDSISINTFDMEDMRPIIFAGDAPNKTGGFTSTESRLCMDNTLDRSLVAGKVVYCDGSGPGQAALNAKAAGSIIPSQGIEDRTFPFPVPTSCVNNTSEIKQYMNSASKPTARIEKTIAVKEESAPIVASFSSRGPNPATPEILSPDITAPGVKILAAWTELASRLTGLPGDERVAKYNIISGTSMACPHASGAAAYVKSFHPTWSPAAIKSALMTTASPINVETNKDQEFAYGAGHLNPVKATNPGLVYDAGTEDFVKFLCGEGYSTEKLRLVTGDNSTSCTKSTNGTVWDLNVPSFTVVTRDFKIANRTFRRTVTNVGSAVSTYRAKVTASSTLEVKVEPSVLTFKALGEKKTFTLTATSPGIALLLGGSLVWEDGVHQVRAPIVGFAI